MIWGVGSRAVVRRFEFFVRVVGEFGRLVISGLVLKRFGFSFFIRNKFFVYFVCLVMNLVCVRERCWKRLGNIESIGLGVDVDVWGGWDSVFGFVFI